MKLLNVKPCDRGTVRALVEYETPTGERLNARIIKQTGFRAYLDPQPHSLTHRDKRHLQREAVKAWADQIGDTLPGLLESEQVFNCGKRFNRLGVQLSVFCPVCDRRTPSDFSRTPAGLIRNACSFCGTLRKGRPYAKAEELEKFNELNARKGTRGNHEPQAV